MSAQVATRREAPNVVAAAVGFVGRARVPAAGLTIIAAPGGDVLRTTRPTGGVKKRRARKVRADSLGREAFRKGRIPVLAIAAGWPDVAVAMLGMGAIHSENEPTSHERTLVGREDVARAGRDSETTERVAHRGRAAGSRNGHKTVTSSRAANNAGKRELTSPTCPTKFRRASWIRRFVVICTVWTKATPKRLRGIW